MAASADHIKAMVKSHSSGDDDGFTRSPCRWLPKLPVRGIIGWLAT